MSISAHISPGPRGDDAIQRMDGPGRRLHVARMAMGLELDRVARELHLRPNLIESLEREDYGSLPAPVYTKGYIRKYARLLGLDPEPLLAAYPSQSQQIESLPPPKPPHPANQIGNSHLVVRLVSVGLLILLVALAYLWWQDERPEPQLETAAAEAQTIGEAPRISDAVEPSASSAAPDQGSETDAAMPEPYGAERLDQGPSSMPGEATAPTAELSQAADAATQPEAPTEATEKTSERPEEIIADESSPAGPNSSAAGASERGLDQPPPPAAASGIVMSFDGPCWVDVRDSERDYRLFGEMKKGDSHRVEGKPPFSFIVGNVAAVRMTVNGEPFDLKAKSKGNVARFKLDAAASQDDEPANASPTP